MFMFNTEKYVKMLRGLPQLELNMGLDSMQHFSQFSTHDITLSIGILDVKSFGLYERAVITHTETNNHE